MEFAPLDSGAFVYIFADVPHAKPLLNYLKFIDKEDAQLQQMIELTQFAAIAAYSPESPREYQLAAWGRYPASRAKMALGASKGWKKFQSSISEDQYWHSAESGLSIAISPGLVFVAVNSSNAFDIPVPIDPFSAAPGTAVPEGFSAFRKGAVLACWLDDPAVVINQTLAEMGIPIEIPAEQLLLSLFPAPEQAEQETERQYEALLRIEVPGAAQARALMTLFSLARGFLSLDAPSSEDNPAAVLTSILFANPPVQDDKYLTIKTNALSGRKIALLFSMFSL